MTSKTIHVARRTVYEAYTEIDRAVGAKHRSCGLYLFETVSFRNIIYCFASAKTGFLSEMIQRIQNVPTIKNRAYSAMFLVTELADMIQGSGD